MDVKVALLNDAVFFKGEERHQGFEFKNKEKFEKEEEISNRKTFNYIKIQ